MRAKFQNYKVSKICLHSGKLLPRSIDNKVDSINSNFTNHTLCGNEVINNKFESYRASEEFLSDLLSSEGQSK